MAKSIDNTKDKNIIYKYNIELSYFYNNKETKLNYTNISNVVINKDYINTHRPSVYITLELDRKLIDDMVKNIGKKHIILNIEKVSGSSDIMDIPEKVKRLPRIRVVRKEFIYVIPSSHINANKEIEYGGENSDRNDIFVPIMIGLLDPETIKENHVKTFYNHYVNTRATDVILHKFKDVKNLVFQPLDNNLKVYNTEGAKTLTKFIELLYKKYKFYDTGYRLFFDYNRAYLISNNGFPVLAKGDDISTIIFNICSPDEYKSKQLGMIVNKPYNHYLINTDITNVHPLNTEKFKDRTDEIKNIAIKGLNHNPSDKRKVDVLFITKEGLDSNEFTINKEYFIDHYNKLDNRRGRFILLSKKDLYSHDGEFFKLNTTMTFKFIRYE